MKARNDEALLFIEEFIILSIFLYTTLRFQEGKAKPAEERLDLKRVPR